MPTTPYSYVILSTARQQLANRLYDPTQTFWSATELDRYIVEALRTWNALTSYWRDDFEFRPTPNTIWYDLTNASQVPGSLRLYTVRDLDLYLVMQNHLLEPDSGVNPWSGVSTQFSADDMLQAVQRRRDEILSITGITYSVRVVPAVPGRIVLPDQVIDIRRMAFQAYNPSLYGIGLYGRGLYSRGSGFGGSVMWPEDTWAEQAFNLGYTLEPAGIPEVYLQSTQPPISFDAYPPPIPGRNYELLTIEAGPALSFPTPQPLSIPDDWTHVIKWGALADLLSRESNAKDALRASYCEQRYQMGLKLLMGAGAPALMAMRFSNEAISLQIDSVREADLFDTGWEQRTPGKPEAILYAGANLFATSPIADNRPYSFVSTVVRNAPVPVNDNDKVQVGRDDLDVVIDYAQHLAAFKLGGAEFVSTFPLLQRFLEQATNYGLKLTELGEFTKALLGLAAAEEQWNPRMSLPQTETQ